MTIKKAFVLAAGLGTRMRPLTDNMPKPMIEVEGRSLIDRALDRLVEAGIELVVVNTHYKAGMLHEHLAKRKDVKILISHEPVRLETGGGILNALDKIGADEPFYVISSDVIWTGNGMAQLANAYNGEGGALLIHKVSDSYGYDGKGDFDLDGRKLSWRREGKKAEYVFTGIQILHPALFEMPDVKKIGDNFPLSSIYKLHLDKFIGVANTGKWYHIGTPEALSGLKLPA